MSISGLGKELKPTLPPFGKCFSYLTKWWPSLHVYLLSFKKNEWDSDGCLPMQKMAPHCETCMGIDAKERFIWITLCCTCWRALYAPFLLSPFYWDNTNSILQTTLPIYDSVSRARHRYIWSDESHSNTKILSDVSNIRVGQEFKHIPPNHPARKKRHAFFCYV